MAIKKLPAEGTRYEVTLILDKETYDRLASKASWDGYSLESYLIHAADNYRSPGC
jgi:hypothetical protein